MTETEWIGDLPYRETREEMAEHYWDDLKLMDPLSESMFAELPDPRMLIMDLDRCVAQNCAPQRWVVNALTASLPRGTDRPGRGKPTANEAILQFARDLVRATHVILAKERGVSHRECFQAVADELTENDIPLGLAGSDATMRRAYYRMLPYMTEEMEKLRNRAEQDGSE